MSYLKHNNGNKKPKPKETKHSPPAPVDPDAVGYLGMCELAEPLRKIADAVRAYAHNATIGENSVALFTGGEGYNPVRLVLEGDAVESIAESLKRIADALTTRPRGDEPCGPHPAR